MSIVRLMFAGAFARRVGVLRLALLSALLLRALLPPGFMLADTAQQGVKVVLCSAHGLIEVTVDPVTNEVRTEPAEQNKKSDKADPPCAFSAIAKLAPPPANSTYMPRLVSAPHAAPSFDVRPGRGLSAPPPPQTGPPLHIA